MDKFIQVMKALSDPIRVRIIKILQERTLCVCEIQALMSLPQPSVSKHLKVLEDAGLIHSSKDGLWVNYCAADGSESPYAASLLGHLKHWLANDGEIKMLRKILPRIHRERICKKD
ncbi:MAG TPA: ArsR family transcriptional regulator [Deltaproteobacteria bacterium]|nr:ArsR family transcriptional regulator [Deltaproteobacteria bacterium]